jgi:hypothetical protein
VLPISEIQEELLEWMASEDSRWTVWTGTDPAIAVQLLNIDDSKVYTRQASITQEMMAYDPNLNVTTEIYRITWVSSTDQEPDANAQWWLSSDNGLTKEKVTFVNKKSRAKRSFWEILLKKM